MDSRKQNNSKLLYKFDLQNRFQFQNLCDQHCIGSFWFHHFKELETFL